jgi:hypothetical protein
MFRCVRHSIKISNVQIDHNNHHQLSHPLLLDTHAAISFPNHANYYTNFNLAAAQNDNHLLVAPEHESNGTARSAPPPDPRRNRQPGSISYCSPVHLQPWRRRAAGAPPAQRRGSHMHDEQSMAASRLRRTSSIYDNDLSIEMDNVSGR